MNCSEIGILILLLAALASPATSAEPAALSTNGSAALSINEPVALTSDGRVKRNPVLVGPAHRELIYAVLERPSQLRLMKLHLESRQSAPLHPNETRSEFDPDLSADGRWLAFVQSRGNLSLGLVVQDLKENRQFEVSPAGGFSGLHSPAIAPDNSRVVYSFPDDERQHLLTCSIDCQDVRRLIDSVGINNWPSFSPDGTQLVFSSSRDGNYELYLSRSDGSAARRLTSSPTQDIRPKWSPDGSRIAFVSNRDSNYEIYCLRPDGSDLIRVTNHPEQDNYPCWTADSRQLIFVGERAGQQELMQISVPE